MSNYFDYILESAERYDEPGYIEESTHDAFNETIADMDLYCFQESLLVAGIIVGALAIIGILIMVLRKLIKGSGSSQGLKKQTAKMEKIVNNLEKKGITEIRTGSAAKEFVASKGGEESSDKGGVVVIEDVVCIKSDKNINMIDYRGETFTNAMKKIGRFINGTMMFFEYAISKKDGNADGARHITDKWRDRVDDVNGAKFPRYDHAHDYKWGEIFQPLQLPTIAECCKDVEIRSIDALRKYCEDFKTDIIPGIEKYISDLKNLERQLKKRGENNDRVFKNKQEDIAYKKNVASCDKFCLSMSTIFDRNIIELERINGSARFVGVA